MNLQKTCNDDVVFSRYGVYHPRIERALFIFTCCTMDVNIYRNIVDMRRNIKYYDYNILDYRQLEYIVSKAADEERTKNQIIGEFDDVAVNPTVLQYFLKAVDDLGRYGILTVKHYDNYVGCLFFSPTDMPWDIAAIDFKTYYLDVNEAIEEGKPEDICFSSRYINVDSEHGNAVKVAYNIISKQEYARLLLERKSSLFTGEVSQFSYEELIGVISDNEKLESSVEGF